MDFMIEIYRILKKNQCEVIRCFYDEAPSQERFYKFLVPNGDIYSIYSEDDGATWQFECDDKPIGGRCTSMKEIKKQFKQLM